MDYVRAIKILFKQLKKNTMNKQFLTIIAFTIIGLSVKAQTIFNNFIPDRAFGSGYITRTIDLDNNGINDFRFHYSNVSGDTILYIETFGENQILVHNLNLPAPLYYRPTIVTTNYLQSYPSLANVDALLPAEMLSTNGDTVYWSSSSVINHNALLFYIQAQGNVINLGISGSQCYDNYYCRLKKPGANNYVYGYIQAFGGMADRALGEFLHIGGTGHNPTINQTAVINFDCTVVTKFEPGTQVPESPTGIFNSSKNNIFSVYPNPAENRINIKADATLLGSVYTIYDNTGKLVLSGKINSENTAIELSGLSTGIYLFNMGERLKQPFKIIKE